MTKKKFIRSKKVNKDTENELQTRKESLSVKTFLKDIWKLIAFILLAFLFIKKILTASGGILWTGWLIIGGCFAFLTGLGMWVSPWVERITGIDQGKAETITVIIFVGIVTLAAYVFWDSIVPFVVSRDK